MHFAPLLLLHHVGGKPLRDGLELRARPASDPAQPPAFARAGNRTLALRLILIAGVIGHRRGCLLSASVCIYPSVTHPN
ncbi:MAG: hypothetical protein EA384_09990 [Spirochaetaceae bacterium]|nr:MAG: hypothetical protein EA384_09990 [Spirochaetaceae bacterium]